MIWSFTQKVGKIFDFWRFEDIFKKKKKLTISDDLKKYIKRQKNFDILKVYEKDNKIDNFLWYEDIHKNIKKIDDFWWYEDKLKKFKKSWFPIIWKLTQENEKIHSWFEDIKI